MSERRPERKPAILALAGDVDASGLPAFSAKVDALIRTGHTRIVFNLRRLAFINSSALGYLIRTVKRLRELDGELVLSEPSPYFRSAVDRLGLDQVFRIFPSDELALEYFHTTGRGGNAADSAADSGAAPPSDYAE
jgi:anti-sigma B factor antagonist